MSTSNLDKPAQIIQSVNEYPQINYHSSFCERFYFVFVDLSLLNNTLFNIRRKNIPIACTSVYTRLLHLFIILSGADYCV
jgi:hypothetical protein